MKALKELLSELTFTCERGNLEKEITAVVYDSRKIVEGCLFVCIKGANFDGHQAAAEAAEKKAAAIIVSQEVELPKQSETTLIRVEDTRYALAFVSAAWFDHPAKKLTTIGITGTKGKTTTTYLVKSILENAGRKVGLVGTIEIIIGDTHIHAVNTTPESYLLQEYFAKMVESGCDTVVMEVSSQALMLHRTQGFVFDFGIFTNLEPDHIGPNEHGSFEEYVHCKSLLFQQCRVGIANVDDVHWQLVTKEHTCSLETYGMSKKADLRAQNLQFTNRQGHLGIAFDVTGLMNFHAEIAMPGRFSVYNSMVTMLVCHLAGISDEAILEGLSKVQVKGRVEMLPVSKDYTLIIDYAHNEVSTRSVLTTLMEYHPKRLICVYGGGGNRSKLRRYDMGEVTGEMADLCVLTCDNPRDEEIRDINNDIKVGLARSNGKYIEIDDRKEAIAYCMKNAKPGDMIVLLGKGHEDYQEIKGVKYHFDEREAVAEILDEMKAGKR